MDSKDILGLAPYGEAVNTAVGKAGDIAKLSAEKLFEWTENFFGTICQPAAGEVGLLLRDRIRGYRAQNLARIAERTQKYTAVDTNGLQLKAPPRLIAELIESGSWCDDAGLQELWAGLVMSSCTPNGNDESSLIFSDLLKRITSAEAKVIDFACRNSKKENRNLSEVVAHYLRVPFKQFKQISGGATLAEAGYIAGHLDALGLIRYGDDHSFQVLTDRNVATNTTKEITLIDITPSKLCLELYVRCQGSRQSVRDYFNVEPLSESTESN